MPHPLRSLLIALVALCLVPTARAAGHSPPKSNEQPLVLFPEKGRHHHPIATKNPEAQKWFDQGMTWYYGFNHAEAVRCFMRAAELDVEAPMPFWGIAMALGPNYNRAIDARDDARKKTAYHAAQKALSLCKDAPANEVAYVKAAAERYPEDPTVDERKFEEAHRDAMRKLHKNYADDPDAAVLYAESMMNLRPWQLWSKDGKPAEETEEIISVLEAVMERCPDHIGANHFYIHAVEASPNPGRALKNARRLVGLVPWAGHLVHMGCHIFIHTGDYEEAAVCNEMAARADEEFMRLSGVKTGVYAMMYYPHNVHFIVAARIQQGRFDEALKAAEKLAAYIEPHLAAMPMMESFTQMPVFTLLRFHRWDELLKLPEPDEKRLVSRTVWHFARATALAMTGRKHEAAKHRDAFEALRKQFPPKAPWGMNSAEGVLAVASEMLQARVAENSEERIKHLQAALAREGELNYGEPQDWYHSVRESLGAALLQAGRANEAEQLFREDLKVNRRSGRSLYGLMESLKAQKKLSDAEWVRQEFECAWPKGVPLRIEDF